MIRFIFFAIISLSLVSATAYATEDIPDKIPIIESIKVLPPEESNPQWMLDATARGQSELDAKLAQEKLAAQNQSTATPPKPKPTPATNNNTAPTAPEVAPTTTVAGINTKAVQTPAVVATNKGTVVASTPDVAILITALLLFGAGILLIIWWLSKKPY